MAAPIPVLDPTGRLDYVDPAALASFQQQGYTLPDPKQLPVLEAREAARFHAENDPLGSIKAATEAGLSTATLGVSSWLEQLAGIANPEDIAARQEANPIASFVGSGAGVLLPLGAEKLTGEALLSGAPGLISRLGEGTTEAAAAALPQATSALGRIGTNLLSQGAGNAIEGAVYGLGQSVSEDSLDPDLTVESALARGGLDALLGAGGGAAIGAPFGLVSSALKEAPSAREMIDRLERYEGERNLKIGGALQSDINRAVKHTNLDDVISQGKEARDLGILNTFNTYEGVNKRATELLQDSSQEMRGIVQSVDERVPGVADGNKVVDAVVNGPLRELRENPFQQAAADKLGGYVAEIRQAMGQLQDENDLVRLAAVRYPEGRMSLDDLWKLRQQVSEAIYGYNGVQDPASTAIKGALRQFRGAISDEMNEAIGRAGEDSGEWKRLNRVYQVASTFEDFSERAIKRNIGNNALSLTEIMAGLAGATHGGPAGLAGAAGFIGARRHGSDVLAASARGLRELLEKRLPEAPLGADIMPDEVGPQSLRKGTVKAAQVEPAGPGGPPTHPATVAALAALEQVQREALQSASEVARDWINEAAATGREARSSAEILKSIERINELANLPEQTADLVQRLTAETQEHAPGMTGKTSEVTGRALNYLQQHAPQAQRPYPLGPEIDPDRGELLDFDERLEAVKDPLGAVRKGPTAAMMDALQVVYPSLTHFLRQAAIAEMARRGPDQVYSLRQTEGLSTLMGTDLTGSANPQAIALSQAAFLTPPKPRPRPARSAKLKGLSERTTPQGDQTLRTA